MLAHLILMAALLGRNIIIEETTDEKTGARKERNFWTVPATSFLFTATPAAYGSSWAKGRIGAEAVTMPQPAAMLDPNPLSKARDSARILTETVLVLNPLSPNGTSQPLLKVAFQHVDKQSSKSFMIK